MNNDNHSFQTLLESLGFSNAMARTYRALLELDRASIRKVSERSGVNRGTTYDALKLLVNEGLVITRQSGERNYYSAESPEKIYDLIRDKRKDLWRSQQQALKIIPEILVNNAHPQGRPLVKYYEDDGGVVMILRDVLRTCGQLEVAEYCAYSTRPVRKYLYRKFPNFTRRRVEENIKVRVIAVGEGGEPADMSERKWLPEPDKTGISSYTLIYGDKVAQISISSDFTPYGVVIEDLGSANLQRLLFNQLWSKL